MSRGSGDARLEKTPQAAARRMNEARWALARTRSRVPLAGGNKLAPAQLSLSITAKRCQGLHTRPQRLIEDRGVAPYSKRVGAVFRRHGILSRGLQGNAI